MSDIIANLQLLKQNCTELSQINDDKRNQVLLNLANRLEEHSVSILAANQLDLAKIPQTDPKYDRLMLTETRINVIADDLRTVTTLNTPLGKILEHRILPNRLDLQKISVPLGVVAVIYESRPNVTIDVFSLCFKSGNGTILKGSQDAWESNQILVKLIRESLIQCGLNPDLLYLMPPEREAVHELLNAVGLVDVCIPRGSQGLIKFVRENAKIPVIETGAGIVHAYFDTSGDSAIGAKIIDNAKTRRVSVCNALDTLLIHHDRLGDLAQLVAPLADKNVIIYADPPSHKMLINVYPTKLLQKANESSFGTEFLDYKLAIKTVEHVHAAISHIHKYSSAHSEVIIATDHDTIEIFLNQVDSAVVYVNASTAFTDGSEFGMGAEIGISTQKLHARGPMALAELTSYKWIVRGSGQIR